MQDLSIYARPMEVHLTPDQQAFVRQAIEAGRVQNEQDAIHEALALWEERERRRTEILAAVDVAEASLTNGQGLPLTEDSVPELSNRVKGRGRTRLNDERSTRR